MESGKGANSPPLTQEQQQQLNNKIKATTKLVSATATLLAGGSTKNITTAGNVGESAVTHNRELHESEQRAKRELQAEATTTQEQQDLEDAAAFKARIHEGVDPNKEPEIYAELYASYKRGQNKIAAQKKLAARIERNQKMDLVQAIIVPKSIGGDSSKLLSAINARHFDYDWVDGSIDWLTSNYNQTSTRIGQTTQLLGGIGGTIGSGLLTFESIKTANTTGVAFGSVGMALGYEYASDGLGGLLSPYKSDTGARAMASLKGELTGFTGKSRAALSLANTALDVGGITAGIKTVSILRQPKTSGTSRASQVKNNNSGDPSDLSGKTSSGSVSQGSGKSSGVGEEILNGQSSKIVLSTKKQLQKKFKHASKFDIVGNYNPSNVKKYQQAINKHINAKSTKEIEGTYRGNKVIFHIDPKTGLTVLQEPNGKFLSGWKLKSDQIINVLERGKL